MYLRRDQKKKHAAHHKYEVYLVIEIEWNLKYIRLD